MNHPLPLPHYHPSAAFPLPPSSSTMDLLLLPSAANSLLPPPPPPLHSSVIVHTHQAEEGKGEERGRKRGRKRTKRREEGKDEEEEEEEGRDGGDEEEEEEEGEGGGREWRRSRKTDPGRISPEATGVRKFISPFAPEATIPLPHELEMSAHGTTVWKRNERERQRVRNLNDGYTQLRERLPLIDRDKRMSKVDSLRLAIAYIRHLELLLHRGHGHRAECACFRRSYGGDGGGGSSAENTPPPD